MIFTYAGCGYLGGVPSEQALEWADGDPDKLVGACLWKTCMERGIPIARNDDEGHAYTLNNDESWKITCRHTTDPTLLLTNRPMDVSDAFIFWGHQMGDLVLLLGVISTGRSEDGKSAKHLLTTEEWLRAFPREQHAA